jgi:hypothetical protein
MSEDHSTSTVCTTAETEDWLAMELAEENGCRGAAVTWSVAHARPILSVASIVVMSLVLGAMIFG